MGDLAKAIAHSETIAFAKWSVRVKNWKWRRMIATSVHLTVQRKVMIPILMFLLVQFLFSSGNHLSLTLNEDPWNEMGGP